MSTLTAAAHDHVDASPELVLEILRDYRVHHPRILPPAFSDFRVLAGGHGDGTVTEFTFRIGGRTTHNRSRITEPEPGVLREQLDERSMVTWFRVTPDGDGARVAIETSWEPAGGPAGLLERAFAPGALVKVYREELRLLQAYAREVALTAAPA